MRENGTIIARYGYDAYERRVWRDTGGVRVHYLFDKSGRPLAEHDAATGALIREYYWVGDLLVAQSNGTEDFAVHGGHLGQPLLMTNAQAQIVWDAEYDPFGGALPTTSTEDNELRYPGQWAEAETGLVHNWHRDYDPTLGRYMQADPLGLAAGQSLYGYAGQSPMNGIDKDGREVIILNSRPFDGLRNSRWGGLEHQALLVTNNKGGWTYFSKDGAEGGGAFGKSVYVIHEFKTLEEAFAHEYLQRYDQALLHVPGDLDTLDPRTRAVFEAALRMITEDYDLASNNCGDLVQRALREAGITIPDTVNPQASINNMRGGFGAFSNDRTGDVFLDISSEINNGN